MLGVVFGWYLSDFGLYKHPGRAAVLTIIWLAWTWDLWAWARLTSCGAAREFDRQQVKHCAVTGWQTHVASPMQIGAPVASTNATVEAFEFVAR